MFRKVLAYPIMVSISDWERELLGWLWDDIACDFAVKRLRLNSSKLSQMTLDQVLVLNSNHSFSHNTGGRR